jgi:hypothetical protein
LYDFAGTSAASSKFSFQSITPDKRVRLGEPASSSGRPLAPNFFGDAMKDFSEATFVPEIVDAMTEALDASVATLPHPVSSTQVNLLAESILRTAQEGERDPAILQRMALLELQITPRQ